MNKIKMAISFILVATMGMITGCKKINSNVVEKDYVIKAKALTEPVHNISEANNKVAFKMLQETININKNENIIISPLSMNTILSLTQKGAAGETKEEMLNALELSGYEDSYINNSYKNIIANYNSLERMQLKIANSIWIDKGLKVHEDFKNMGRENYEAQIKNVDFSKKGTLDTINKWIEDHTNGKIKDIVDSLDGTAVVLINSVYFKGKWLNQFKENMTSKREFTNSEGKVKDVDMMKDTFQVQHIKGDTFESIRLPYEDENFGMYIFLPNEDNNIENMLKEIDFTNWKEFTKEVSTEEVEVQLPKFKIEFEQELNEMLQGFGMKKAFGGDADFSNMSKEDDIFIDLVKQKCFIEVDEAGTEATAVTAVIMRYGASPQGEIPQFIVNRPFVYAIADNNTGLILFMGAVNKF